MKSVSANVRHMCSERSTCMSKKTKTMYESEWFGATVALGQIRTCTYACSQSICTIASYELQ